MEAVISEGRALEIVHEFLNEILNDYNDILALYIIGSLDGGYYRPGQSDIDTLIIVNNEATVTQEQMDEVAEKYELKYSVPKGFGAVVIRLEDLFPPYDNYEYTEEVARLKMQGKVMYGKINLEDIKMPSTADFIEDALAKEKWLDEKDGEELFYKFPIRGCVNIIVSYLSRYTMIKAGVFEFNKFKKIETYMRHDPLMVNESVFDFIQKQLRGEVQGDEADLDMLRNFGTQLRAFFKEWLQSDEIQAKRESL